VLSHKVDKLIEDATKASFSYWEERMDNSDGTVSEFSISVWYYKTTKAWTFKVWVDGREVANKSGSGFNDLINDLSARLATPLKGSREYQDLLEWKSMNPPAQQAQATSSKTNKEKFKELTDYMIANANFVSNKKVSKAGAFGIGDYGFIYKESVNMNGQDFILTLVVNYGNKHNSSSTAWKCELYMDTQFIKEVQGNGMEELLQELKGNFKVPTTGSPEYKSLTESFSIADDFKLYESLWG
jgi:hypothetical protein